MATEKKEYKVIGTRPIRHDGVDKVTGRALYGADFQMTGLLHGRVLRSPHMPMRELYRLTPAVPKPIRALKALSPLKTCLMLRTESLTSAKVRSISSISVITSWRAIRPCTRDTPLPLSPRRVRISRKKLANSLRSNTRCCHPS